MTIINIQPPTKKAFVGLYNSFDKLNYFDIILAVYSGNTSTYSIEKAIGKAHSTVVVQMERLEQAGFISNKIEDTKYRKKNHWYFTPANKKLVVKIILNPFIERVKKLKLEMV